MLEVWGPVFTESYSLFFPLSFFPSSFLLKMTSSATPSYFRLSTVLNGAVHWLSLGEPIGIDGCRRIYLSTDVRKSALMEFTRDCEEDDTGYLEFVEIRYTEPGLLRPIMGNFDLSALGTVAYVMPSDIEWRRVPAAEGGYLLHIASNADLAIVVSHTVGLRRKSDPYLLIGEQSLRENSAAVFEFVDADLDLLIELQDAYGDSLRCPCCGFDYVTNGPELDPATGDYREPCAGCNITFAIRMSGWIEEWRAWDKEDAADRLEQRIADFKATGE